jgi:hypothetical protein
MWKVAVVVAVARRAVEAKSMMFCGWSISWSLFADGEKLASGCGAKARFFFRFRDKVPNSPFHILVLHSTLEIRYIIDLKRVVVTLSL